MCRIGGTICWTSEYIVVWFRKSIPGDGSFDYPVVVDKSNAVFRKDFESITVWLFFALSYF